MLDGKLVRTIYDISTDDGVDDEVLIDAGTEFVWDGSTIDQNIDGLLAFVDEDEVELVDE